MSPGRLEAFSDGVIAILITIMVLGLHVTKGSDWAALRTVLPTFLAYVLSFVFLGIYWNNHHHLLSTLETVNGGVLWANLHLLFWLSMIPFATAWLGENAVDALPAAVYAAVGFMASVAYYILARAIIRTQRTHSTLAAAVGSDVKGRASTVTYAIAILVALAGPVFPLAPYLAVAAYVAVAAMWLIPDRRIERTSTQAAKE